MALKNMNSELKKVVSRVKAAQSQLQTLIKDRTWVEQAKKYAERQGDEVKKLINSDVSKLKTFLEREKKELEKLQKMLPTEVDKLKDFVANQKKELSMLMASLKKGPAAAPRKKAKKPAAAKKAKASAKTGARTKKKSSGGARASA